MSLARRIRFWRSVLFIGVRDLANEKLITLCLILSVTAVLTPILLVASVKVGFIDRLKSEFIDDPSFREIRPADADLRQTDYFEQIRQWKGVSYAMPSVMLVPREVTFIYEKDGRKRAGEAKLYPSGKTDPYLAKIQGTPPEGDGVVITSDVAKENGLTIGTEITLAVDRIERDRRKRVELPMKVVGIIPDEAVPQPTILALPAIDRQVENYRAGIAVPERGWPGVGAVPKQSFENVVAVTDTPLGATATNDLRIHLGASSIERVDEKRIAGQYGYARSDFAGPGGRYYYLLDKERGRFTSGDLNEAAAVLHNRTAQVLGVNPVLTVSVLGVEAPMVGPDPMFLPTALAGAAGWKISPHASYAFNNGVFLPPAAMEEWKAKGEPGTIELKLQPRGEWASGDIDIAVHVLGPSPGDNIVASPSLLGMLYRGVDVPIVYDRISNNIAEESVGYRGFRVIADNIDVVPELVDKFEKAGTHVRAKSDQIIKLQRLDKSLNILVLVVAVVAIAGGFAILSASFFANVQRKRVDYATIRLIGMQKSAVAKVPLVQALIIAGLGFVSSLITYALVSGFLNHVIAAQLGFDGQLSKLHTIHFLVVGFSVLAGSALASLSASREATRIDPAQAIRAA